MSSHEREALTWLPRRLRRRQALQHENRPPALALPLKGGGEEGGWLALVTGVDVARAAWFVAVPLVSSLLLTASLPPYDVGMLAWVSLVPLLVAMHRATCHHAMTLSALFGALFGFESFTWFRQLQEVSLPAYLLLVFGFTGYFLLFGWLYARVNAWRPAWLIVAGPAFWVSLEYVRGNLAFLSLPWNLAGHSQYRYLPVIQVTALVGVYGLSFLIVMVNQALSEVVSFWMGTGTPRTASQSPTAPPTPALPLTGGGEGGGAERGLWSGPIVSVLIAATLLVLTLSYGWSVLGNTRPSETIRVAVVQPNLLTRDRMTPPEQIAHLRAYQELTREAVKLHPDLIVWPASALPGSIQSNRLISFMTRRIATESGAFLLAGGAGGDKLRPKKEGYLNYSNSEFLLSPAGKLIGQYHKMRLLPFNEYRPLQGIIPWPDWVTSLKESFEAGTEYTLFEVDGARFGAPICWENMFGDHFRQFVKAGAQFMVTSANEGFFGPVSQAPYQTLAMNIFRAVENRRAVVRTTTTGISGFISPAGELLEMVKNPEGRTVFVSGYLVRDIPLATEPTFYTMHGELFAYAAIGLAVGLIIWTSLSRRTQKKKMRGEINA